MDYPIPSDISRRINSLVAGGFFQNEDEVLREALASLEHRLNVTERLRREVQQADDDIAAGRVAEFDAEKTKLAVRERLASFGIKH